MTASRDPALEDPAAGKLLSFDGFVFLPISAAISVFAAISFLTMLLAKKNPLPPDAQTVLHVAFSVTFVAALADSLLGLIVLLIHGLASAGTLVLGGWRFSGTT